MKYLRYIFPLFIFSVGNAQAQDPKKLEEKAVTEEIEVIRPYKPVLAEAVKLRRSPDLENVQTYKARFSYNVLDRKLEMNADINKLQAQKLADQRQAALFNNYVKAGFGSLSTFLAEGYFNTGRDEALQAGAFVRHFGQNGKLPGQDETKQQVTVFGKSIGAQATLTGKLNYERHGLMFYGTPTVPVVNATIDKQSFNFLEAEGEVVNTFNADPEALSYAAKVNAYSFGDKFDAREHLISMSASLNKRLQDFNFGLGISTEIGKTKDIAVATNNNLVRLNPYLRLQKQGVKITAGINFVQEFGAISKSRIFPAATADLTLIPDFLQIFAEVNGDVNRTTLKDLTDENPFLGPNIELKNSVEKLALSLGIKGTAGPGFGYKIKAFSKKVSDLPLFVNNFANATRFDVLYDTGNTRITGVEAEMSVQISNDFNWTGKINLQQFKSGSETKSWYKPPVFASSDLVYTYDRKFSFTASVYFQGDASAKTYAAAPTVPYTSDPSNELYSNVKGFVDLGVGANYKINNKFGAFAKINNLFNQNYSKYLYYPSNGFNIYGGLSYSF